MDNNMIHIDDLVRQRLRGGEEPERPGAWLTMRELLDKEMPVSAGVNWRRMIGYFTALLLLTTASVGGYKLYNGHTGSTRLAAGGGRNDDGPSGVSRQDVPLVALNNATAGQDANPTVPGNSNPAKASTSASQLNSPSNSSPTTSRQTASNTHKASNQAELTGANNESGATGSVRSSAVTAASNATLSRQDAAVIAAAANHAQASTSGNARSVVSRPSNTYASAGSATVRGRRSESHTANPSITNNTRTLQSSPDATQTVASIPKPAIVAMNRETKTVQRLEIVYRRMYDAETQKPYYRIDTFPAGNIVVERVTPSVREEVANTETPSKGSRKGLFGLGRKRSNGNEPTVALKNTSAGYASGSKNVLAPAQEPVPGASISAKAPEQDAGTGLVANSNAKHFRLLNAEKMNAAIDQARFKLSKIEMYPGVMGGINASLFTPNALGGFQLGLTSLFALNEWWSLMLEAKYVLRFNTGSSVRDDYKEVIDNSTSIRQTTYQGQDFWDYQWTDRTVQHSFNYDLVRTIEIPVMLRRNFNHWYVQFGANLVFSSPIDAKEVSAPLNDNKNHSELRPYVANVQPGKFITNDHATVLSTDFGSRFGTGYVISGGYMFSPAVYVDARFTQTVWDNSKTGGAKQVSADLLRSPSIQFSVGYRFNTKK